jgi:hypothetical protein
MAFSVEEQVFKGSQIKWASCIKMDFKELNKTRSGYEGGELLICINKTIS